MIFLYYKCFVIIFCSERDTIIMQKQLADSLNALIDGSLPLVNRFKTYPGLKMSNKYLSWSLAPHCTTRYD
jgi:hypothetical protein